MVELPQQPDCLALIVHLESPIMFATTRWSIVRAAGGEAGSTAREALTTLCESYWYPLYAYARRQGTSPTDAEDHIQAFFAFVLEGKLISAADPLRGRFRAFLLRSLQNFLHSQHRQATAIKRGGGRAIQSLNSESAEERYQLEPTAEETPERLFERQWALTLLQSALDQVREEYVSSGQTQLWTELEAHLRQDESKVPYAELATRLEMSEEGVKSAAHRLRKRYRERLRAAVADTLENEDDVDDELRLLRQAVAR